MQLQQPAPYSEDNTSSPYAKDFSRSRMNMPKLGRLSHYRPGVKSLYALTILGLLAGNLYFSYRTHDYLYYGGDTAAISLGTYNIKPVVAEVSKLTTINTTTDPIYDVIKDAQGIRDTNQLNAGVYKDAKDGDFVLGFEDKMIIYRRSENKIIYEVPSPKQMANQQTAEFIQKVIKAGQEAKLLKEGADVEIPQLSVVTDQASMQKHASGFYNEAKDGDLIAIFPTEEVIILYRPSENKIIKSGDYRLVIE